jgi:hypothetical protein
MRREDVAAVAMILLTGLITWGVYSGMESRGTMAFVITLVISAIIAGSIVGAALFGIDVSRKMRE